MTLLQCSSLLQFVFLQLTQPGLLQCSSCSSPFIGQEHYWSGKPRHPVTDDLLQCDPRARLMCREPLASICAELAPVSDGHAGLLLKKCRGGRTILVVVIAPICGIESRDVNALIADHRRPIEREGVRATRRATGRCEHGHSQRYRPPHHQSPFRSASTDDRRHSTRPEGSSQHRGTA